MVAKVVALNALRTTQGSSGPDPLVEVKTSNIPVLYALKLVSLRGI